MFVSTQHAHSPGPYSLSLLLHGIAALVIVLPAFVFNDAGKNSATQIIELVAGPGDNYMATEAPALGGPGDIAIIPPPAERPRPAPPEPVAPSASVPATPPPGTPVIPPAPKPKAPPKTTPKADPPPKAMTKADFDKLNAAKNKNMPSSKVASNTARQPGATAKPIVAPKVGKGLAAGVLGGTGTGAGAGGTTLTAAERDQMGGYFALLAQRIREAQEQPEGLSNELVVSIETQVFANGAIGAVKVVRSSGNRAFDDSVLKAIRSVRPIGPRPDGRNGAWPADFRMRD